MFVRGFNCDSCSLSVWFLDFPATNRRWSRIRYRAPCRWAAYHARTVFDQCADVKPEFIALVLVSEMNRWLWNVFWDEMTGMPLICYLQLWPSECLKSNFLVLNFLQGCKQDCDLAELWSVRAWLFKLGESNSNKRGVSKYKLELGSRMSCMNELSSSQTNIN